MSLSTKGPKPLNGDKCQKKHQIQTISTPRVFQLHPIYVDALHELEWNLFECETQSYESYESFLCVEAHKCSDKLAHALKCAKIPKQYICFPGTPKHRCLLRGRQCRLRQLSLNFSSWFPLDRFFLSRHGHSSRTKKWHLQNFREFHVCLLQNPSWITMPLMKIHSSPAKLGQILTW